MKHIARSLAFVVAWASTAAMAETISFDLLPAGTIVSTQYAGVTFTPNAFSGPGSSGSGMEWATNTDLSVTAAEGGDVSILGTPPLVSGMVLRTLSGWYLEDGDASFMVSFATPISSFSASFASVSFPEDVTMWAYNGDSLISSVSGTTEGQFELSLAAASITSVAIRPGSFDDWVAVDNISYTPAVPEPGAAVLFAAGLGLLVMRRSRRL